MAFGFLRHCVKPFSCSFIVLCGQPFCLLVWPFAFAFFASLKDPVDEKPLPLPTIIPPWTLIVFTPSTIVALQNQVWNPISARWQVSSLHHPPHTGNNTQRPLAAYGQNSQDAIFTPTPCRLPSLAPQAVAIIKVESRSQKWTRRLLHLRRHTKGTIEAGVVKLNWHTTHRPHGCKPPGQSLPGRWCTRRTPAHSPAPGIPATSM